MNAFDINRSLTHAHVTANLTSSSSRSTLLNGDHGSTSCVICLGKHLNDCKDIGGTGNGDTELQVQPAFIFQYFGPKMADMLVREAHLDADSTVKGFYSQCV